MRTIIIGDIHGCHRQLSDLLTFLNPDPDTDRLILLGDLFDRGPDSWEVFQTVQWLAASFGDRFVLLRGNHEDYLLTEKLTLKQRMVWNRVGRGTTAASFKKHGARMEDAIPFLEEHTQLYFREEGLQCVHAGLAVDPIWDNDPWTMVHDHGIVLQNQYAGPFTVTGHIALEVPVWFAGDGEYTEVVPWGEDRLLPPQGILCIDTGCGKGGPLTALVLEDGVARLERTLG